MEKPLTESAAIAQESAGSSVEEIVSAILRNLFYLQGKFNDISTWNDWYLAVAYSVRELLLSRWISTTQTLLKKNIRTVCYLCAEFMIGPQLVSNLLNIEALEQFQQAAEQLGLDFDELVEQEEEPGLGNGGLGRLAACYLDSLATLKIPAIGYGIRYEYGIFTQGITQGWQVETTDNWLRLGNPWELPRPERTFEVQFGGTTSGSFDERGRYRARWLPGKVVSGVPYDTPLTGYHNGHANTLRLWKAEARKSFDFAEFNVGNYFGSVYEKITSETISKVLYPNDAPAQGRQLRLEQQYFFVSCSLQDLIATHAFAGLHNFNERVCIQLNDTHPAIAIAELMRLLIDKHDMDWDTAWQISRQSFAYTNHTLMPEALEQWPLALFASVLPRHLEIIFELNRRFLSEVKERFPDDHARVRRMSLIGEDGERTVRMANLACLGSFAINGVAALHTDLLKNHVLRDFYEMWPEKFINITNGVTPRRFVLVSNPRLSKLITEQIGGDWVTDLERLRELEKLVDDAEFLEKWCKVKRMMKRALATYIEEHMGVSLDLNSLFDVQVKRIHEYKRQHLNVLHILTLYNRIKNDPACEILPRTFIFGGKAAPGYYQAKVIVKLIHCLSDIINNDQEVKGRLKVIFLPNFNVKLGQRVYPACDLSEQISTAGMEASGTGNMKFAMNGALTIGTMDGANIEIREAVGSDNFFSFGLDADSVMRMKRDGYRPRDLYLNNEQLRQAIDFISDGSAFSPDDRELFRPLVDSLLNRDDFMLLADYQSYIDSQEQVGMVFRDQQAWARKSILNTARMGKFSSDRSIREYCDQIWQVRPFEIEPDDLVNQV